MGLPVGYQPPNLLPRIKIFDRDNVLQYTYDSFGTQDVKLSTLGLHVGVGIDHGSLDLLLIDENNILTDSTIRGRDVLIKPQWTVELDFGNTQGGLTNWFDGILYDAGLDRPFNNFQTVHLVAFGKGIRFQDRLTQIKRVQARAADGLGFDATDTAAKGTELMKDLFEDEDHFLHSGLSAETGFTTGGIVDFDAKLADFNKDSITMSSAAQEIANRLGMIWGINAATQEIYMHHRGTKDSGLLITNNYTDVLTTGWNKTKLCLMKNQPIGWRDTTIGYGYSIIIGKGVFDDTLQVEQTSANAALNMDSFDQFGFPFTALSEDVSKIALYLSKVGTPSKPLLISIVADNGTPEPDEVIREVEIQPEFLQSKVTTGGDWFEYPFRTLNALTPLSINEPYYVVIKKYDDGANDIRVDYQTGTGTYYTKSGATWSSATGDLKMRIYHSKAVDIIFENLQSKKKFGTREMSIPLGDFPTVDSGIEALKSLSRVIGKTNRIYKPIVIAPPQAPPQVGKRTRIIDKFNGLDQFVDLIAYDIRVDAYGDSARGATEMTVHLEDLFY